MNALQTSQHSKDPLRDRKPSQSDFFMSFTKQNIDKMFEIIKSEENVKFIGVFLHLSYWSVFGGVNPVQIDLTTKKKMFLIISETMEYFKSCSNFYPLQDDYLQPTNIVFNGIPWYRNLNQQEKLLINDEWNMYRQQLSDEIFQNPHMFDSVNDTFTYWKNNQHREISFSRLKIYKKKIFIN